MHGDDMQAPCKLSALSVTYNPFVIMICQLLTAAFWSLVGHSRAPLAARPDLGDGGSLRPVVDLLVEQIECADFVLLNKIDMVPGGMDGDGVQQLCAIVATLNPLATVIPCEHSKVRSLGQPRGKGTTRNRGTCAQHAKG